MTILNIEQAAKLLAKENAKSEETISKIYWFPHDKQIRLVEVDTESIRSKDEEIHAFYFNPLDVIPHPSGVALIHPDEDQKSKLPSEWGVDWSAAKVVFERGTRKKK